MISSDRVIRYLLLVRRSLGEGGSVISNAAQQQRTDNL